MTHLCFHLAGRAPFFGSRRYALLTFLNVAVFHLMKNEAIAVWNFRDDFDFLFLTNSMLK